MINRSITVKASIPPLLEPAPNLKGSTTLNELAEEHVERLTAFLQRNPYADQPSSTPMLEYWVRSDSEFPAETRQTEIQEHNPYRHPSSYPEEAVPPRMMRAFSLAKGTLRRWGSAISRSFGPDKPTMPKPEQESTSRYRFLRWSVWKDLWLTLRSQKHGKFPWLLVLLGVAFLGVMILAFRRPTQGFHPPQSVLQAVQQRMEWLEDRWYDQLQRVVKQTTSPHSWRRETQQWLQNLGRDREERIFLRTLQHKLVAHFTSSHASGMTKPIIKPMTPQQWQTLLTSRLNVIERSEEQLYSQLQRVSRRKQQPPWHTRHLLQQLEQIRSERIFLSRIKKNLLGT